jgi:hypothetical protein
VTGGLIPPDGCGWGDDPARYYFADYGSGRVWTLDVKADRSGAVAGSRREFARIQSVVSFRMGPDGAMYIASYGTGTIHRLVPKSVPSSCSSATGTPGVPVVPGLDSGAAVPPAAGGTGTAAGTGSGDGCGCNLAARRSSSFAGLAATLGVLATALRARRRATSAR